MRGTLFARPKAGHRADEYEDAAAYGRERGLPLRAAVADGATESAFAGTWARRVAEGFVAADADDAETLALHVAAWQAAHGRAVAARTASLPWYAAAKAEEGAFAALLGLVVQPGGTWRALAVGDCCLFHLEPDGAWTAWPFDDPAAFSNRPALLGSRPGVPVPPVLTRAGAWQPGEAFVLATDALAAWLLAAGPARALGWRKDAFRREIDAARRDGTLRNDDVTALIVRP